MRMRTRMNLRECISTIEHDDLLTVSKSESREEYSSLLSVYYDIIRQYKDTKRHCNRANFVVRLDHRQGTKMLLRYIKEGDTLWMPV